MIDGKRVRGVGMQFLPIVNAGGCFGTVPVERAAVPLRLLREAPPPEELRLVGHVERLDGSTGEKSAFLAGATVQVIGASSTRSAITDAEGIYEVRDLVPDDYTVRVAGLENQCASERKVPKEWLRRQKRLQLDLFIDRCVSSASVRGRGDR